VLGLEADQNWLQLEKMELRDLWSTIRAINPFSRKANAMRPGRISILVLLGMLSIGHPVIAQQSATEAPPGFDTPTLAVNPGSQSTSNGIAEPNGDTFAHDQQIYEQIHDVNSGLGPVYNGRACAECHQNPVSGGASQFTELRVGHRDADGNFVNPTVSINDGANSIGGRSIINDRAVIPQAQEHVPVTEDIRTLRAALNTLGDGFVEAIDDSTLLAIAEDQPEVSEGRIHGEAIRVPVLEAPGQIRVGRFGWKDQHSSLLSFIGDAYLNEMGVTNRLRPKDTTTVGKTTSDPEDVPDQLGLADIDHFTQFVRGTKVPPRDAVLAASAAGQAGQIVFERIRCDTCHVESIITAPAGTVINGGAFTVPEALGNKIIHPFSDFLLHDIGTGDGIVQNPPQDTANKLRTAALWGLRMRPRFMHDLKSLTLEEAINRHRGEAEDVTRQFGELSPTEKQQLFTFLNSL
jgi:Di-haem oxidoreductase, putative peroxidase